MGLFGEFKEFAFKGNVLDMAIGIVLGVAFGNVVSSFVRDLLSPPLGLLLGDQGLSQAFWVIRGGSYDTLAQAQADGAVVLTYGQFLNVVLEFALVAFALFLFVRTVNRWRRKQEATPKPDLPTCPHCREAVAEQATRCKWCTGEIPTATSSP